jgi:hypothetical protein
VQRLEEVLVPLKTRRVRAGTRLLIARLAEVEVDIARCFGVEVVLRTSTNDVGVCRRNSEWSVK